MEMDWALQTVIGLGHLMEKLMAMSLVHSTDVPTVKLMVLMMEMHLEQPMVRRWVQLTEILKELCLVCLLDCWTAMQMAQMKESYLVQLTEKSLVQLTEKNSEHLTELQLVTPKEMSLVG